MGMSMSVAELRRLPEAELIRLHDEHAKNTVVGTGYYLDELARRDAARQTRWLLWLTRVITLLTVVNVVVVIIAV